ncbi:MAG: hypothetical protein B6D46_06290 [Polyangiaceae bacterium UTPRO1]|nr:DUF4115 domain-containing protein [Myxococcales bacterium]OQY67633.1 MAG: hypothetical protein B6D46_06290 [Polyangiaceae bacterium UTPRO1]
MFERSRIADTLRNARERGGMTVEEAAAAAGVPLPYVRLLEGESNVRVGIPDAIYLIPFFRKYASFLSIDSEELLPDFLGILQQDGGEPRSPTRLDYRPRHAGWWKPFAAPVTIGIAVALLRQAGNSPSFDNVSTDEPIASATSTGVSATAQPSSLSSAEETATPMSPTSIVPQEATSTGVHVLTITAKEESWLALTIEDQSTKQYLLHAGESRTWSGARFSITIGNAGGVALILDGRGLPPIGKPGQVIHNLRFPAVTPRPSPTAS